jgi:hypothetical protein
LRKSRSSSIARNWYCVECSRQHPLRAESSHQRLGEATHCELAPPLGLALEREVLRDQQQAEVLEEAEVAVLMLGGVREVAPVGVQGAHHELRLLAVQQSLAAGLSGQEAEIARPVGGRLRVPRKAPEAGPELARVRLDPVERDVARLPEKPLVAGPHVRVQQRVNPDPAVQVLAVGAAPERVLGPVDRRLEPHVEVENLELPSPGGLPHLARILPLGDRAVRRAARALELAGRSSLAAALGLLALSALAHLAALRLRRRGGAVRDIAG